MPVSQYTSSVPQTQSSAQRDKHNTTATFTTMRPNIGIYINAPPSLAMIQVSGASSMNLQSYINPMNPMNVNPVCQMTYMNLVSTLNAANFPAPESSMNPIEILV